jgi:hypothetical protein
MTRMVKSKMSKVVNRYYTKHTKIRCKKIGDALLYSCSAIGATGIFGYDLIKETFSPTAVKIVVGCVLLLGVVGKFLSNFCKQDEKEINES